MKKIVIAAIVLAVFILAVAAIPARQNQADFLRIHIRADSNSQPDQSVKYKVKAAVVGNGLERGEFGLAVNAEKEDDEDEGEKSDKNSD